MTIVTDDPRGSVADGTASAAHTRRFPEMSPLRFSSVNVAIATLVAIALSVVEPGQPGPAEVPVRDALSAWMPARNPNSALAAWTSSLAQLDDWAQGKRRYAETLAVLRPAAPLPPAGAVVAPLFTGTARILALREDRPTPRGVAIELRHATVTDGEQVSLPMELGPFWQSAQLDLRLTTSGFFGLGARRSAWQSVTLADTPRAIVEFPDATEWAPAVRLIAAWKADSALTDASSGFAPDTVVADSVSERGDWKLPWRRGESRPSVRTLNVGSEYRNAATLEIRGDRRYTGVCAWSTAGRLPSVRARRSDTQQFIGASTPEVPLFAVVADRFATIQLEVAARSAADLKDVRFVAVTADDLPGLPLFVETIGHALAPLRINGVTADVAAHRRAGLWLREALGVEWNARDIEVIAASDEELAAILGALQQGRP